MIAGYLFMLFCKRSCLLIKKENERDKEDYLNHD